MSQSIDRALRERIDQFVDEISDLVRQAAVEAVQEALGAGGAVAPSRGPGRPRKAAAAAPKRARKGKRIRRTEADLAKLADDILAYVQGNPGGRLGDIAKALGEETKDVRRPAFALVEEGKLRTEGQRGGTRYFPGGRKAAPAKAAKAAKKKTTRKKSSKKKGRS